MQTTTHRVPKRHRKLLAAANAAAREKDFEKANHLFRSYLEIDPTNPGVLFNLGVIQQHFAGMEKDPVRMHALCVEAVAFYAQAIESPIVDIETKASCLNNHGLIMGKLGFPEKAKIAFHFALQLNPNLRAARVNYADVLVFEGEYDEADRQFFEIINSDPNSAGAQFSRSMILLLMGDIRRGFREYRARFRVPTFPSKILATEKPMWDGEPLDGKTLLITCEQGWGDSIQFIRYAEVVKTAFPAAKVVYLGAESMHKLILSAAGVDECVNEPLPLPHAFDYHIPLMHLPDVFATSIETIPANVPYITRRPDWGAVDIEPTDKRKVGLVWAGSPTHGKDKWRSMRPEQFQEFIDAAPQCQFYSLQCGPRAHEAAQLSNCTHLAPQIFDWTQTADAILKMDLVITVDTAVAHLAGALGVPVWILIPSSPDFRWMLTRTDSPWYPTAKLYRQPAKDDWRTPMEQIKRDLSDL